MRLFFRFTSYAIVLMAVILVSPLTESLKIENLNLEKSQETYLSSDAQEVLTEDAEESLENSQNETGDIAEETDNLRVKKVIDGDTIVLDDNRVVRLIGINTPEKYQKFGKEATLKTKELTENKEVMLEYDRGRYDKYGRVLAYVYTEEYFVNYELLRQGIANLMIIPPNTKYFNQFKKARDEAKAERLGIWKGE